MSGAPNGVPSGGQLLRKVGDFEIIAKLGQGAMGAVFKARQVMLDRIVALKVLPPGIAKDQNFIERFVREARASAKLSHPNVVAGIDVGQDQATKLWYFAMEFVDGPTVRQMQDREARIPEDRALRIACDIARALDCAHQAGMVHRDVKPDNILMMSDGSAKLADLGLARQSNEDSSLTQSGQALGTPYYMAPEQARGENETLDTRADLYALGATLFHMVTGVPPFTGETSAVIMAKHLTEPPPLAQRVCPEVSQGCSRLIHRLMQKDKARRYQTPREVVDQIEALLKLPVEARAETTGPRRPVRASTAAQSAVRGTADLHDVVRGRRRGSARDGTPPEGERKTLPLVLGSVAGLVVLALLGVLAFGGKGDRDTAAARKEPSGSNAAPSVRVPELPEKKAPVVTPTPVKKAASGEDKNAPPIAKPVVPEREPPVAAITPAPTDPKPTANVATDVPDGGEVLKPVDPDEAKQPNGVEATIYWLMADDMDIYQNGKPLRDYTPSFRTRPDEARKTQAYSARITLRPGDVFTVGGRRGGSYGGTVVVLDGEKKLIWWSNTKDWRVYDPADPARWYLPEVAMRSKKRPVQVAQSFGFQAAMKAMHKGIPQPIWDNPGQRFVYMVGIYRQDEAATPPPPPEEAKGTPSRKTELAYQALLKETAPLLLKNQFDDAIALWDRKANDPGLKEAAEWLTQEQADMKAVNALRATTIEGLRGQAGQTIELQIGNRMERGQVLVEATRKGVTLNVGGAEFSFPPERICAGDIDRYAPKTVQAEDLRLRGILFLYAGDEDRAKDYFGQAQKAGAAIETLQLYLDRLAAVEKAEAPKEDPKAIAGRPQAAVLLPEGAVFHISFEKDTLVQKDNRWYLRNLIGKEKGQLVAWTNAAPKLVEDGMKGSACKFDGVADGITSNGDEMDASHITGTVGLWVRASDPRSTRSILYTAERRNRVVWTESGQFKASMFTGTQYEVVGGGVVDVAWHHVVFAWDIQKGTFMLYVDAQLVGSRTGRSWTSVARDEPTVYGSAVAGELGMSTRPAFEGLIDEVVVWDRVLTPEEIKQLYLAYRR